MPLTIEERVAELEQAEKTSKGSAAAKLVKDLGIIGILLALVGAVVIYFASKSALDRVQQKLSDVTGQLAIAEDHLKSLQTKVDAEAGLAKKLENADADKIGKVLDQVQRPEVTKLLQAGHIEQQIQILGEQVGSIYEAADAAYIMSAKKDFDSVHLFLGIIGDRWDKETGLPEQSFGGTITSGWHINHPIKR